MSRFSAFLALFLSCCGGLVTPQPVAGDLVRLRSGAEVRGTILTAVTIAPDGTIVVQPTEANVEPSTAIAVETLSGGRVEFATDLVAFVSRRPLNLERYEVRARQTPETLEDQWALAQWCREQHLVEQHELHCQQVLNLAPDHEAAHRALGHVWKDGAWVDWDLYMTERGYVKHRSRWVTQQEFELLAKTAAELEREQEWYPKIRLWLNWITGNNASRVDQGFQAFRTVQDGDAAPAIQRLMGQHANRDVRLLAVQVLAQSASPKAAGALAEIILNDADAEIRRLALQGIPQDFYAHAQPFFIQKLKSPNNAQVNRAAFALQRVGNEEAITPLINALVTTHRYSVQTRVGAANAYSFGADGSFGGQTSGLPAQVEMGLRTGQYPNGVIVLPPNDPALQRGPTKVVTVQRHEQNPEVLTALRKLTSEDYQFDERTWHLWWSAQKHQGDFSKS